MLKRQVGVLSRLKIKKIITAPGDLSPKLYSGSFKDFNAPSLSILQSPLQAQSYMTYKIYKNTAIIKFWRHTYLPFGQNVKLY